MYINCEIYFSRANFSARSFHFAVSFADCSAESPREVNEGRVRGELQLARRRIVVVGNEREGGRFNLTSVGKSASRTISLPPPFPPPFSLFQFLLLVLSPVNKSFTVSVRGTSSLTCPFRRPIHRMTFPPARYFIVSRYTSPPHDRGRALGRGERERESCTQ